MTHGSDRQQCQSMLLLTDTVCGAADESSNEWFPVVPLLPLLWVFIRLPISCGFKLTAY